MGLEKYLVGALEFIVGAFLVATGIGGGLGVKLLLAGTLSLISAFMSARTGQDGFKSSPTYGYGDLGNAQFEGSPIPIVYGENKMKPGIVSTNMKFEGGAQVLYLLLLLGEGPIESVASIRLNDVPIDSFTGAAAYTDRLGQVGQTVIPGFNETGAQYSAGTPLDEKATHVYEMKAAADQLTAELVYQSGLYNISPNGGVNSARSDIKVEVKPYGSPDTAYVAYSPATLDGATWTNETKQAGIWSTWGPEGKPTMSREAVRLQIALRFDGVSKRPARGRYSVRLTGFGPTKKAAQNTPNIVSMLEVNNDGRTYDGMALLGLKLPATAQLSGIPAVSCMVKGRKVYDPRSGLTVYSQNPVLCVRDLLTNTVYGEGVDASRLDTASWNAMADACDVLVTPVAGGTPEPRWQIDYVVDVQSPTADHVEQMLSTCRMTIVEAGRKFYIVQDAVRSSDGDFEARAAAAPTLRRNVRDEGSPARSTLVASSLDALQRWTKVRVVYVDRNRGYEQRRVEIYDQYANVGAIAGGTFGVGHQFKGTTSKALGILTASYVNGVRYLTFAQDDGAVVFQNGETVTDLVSGATAVLSSAPYTVSPERVLDVQLYGITRRTQAIREARYQLNLARSRTRFANWGTYLGDLKYLPGDVVGMSADHLPWNGKLFTVLTCGFDAEGLATTSAREYSADVFTDNVDTTQVDSLAYLPGGAVPPGLRPPGTDTPSDTGSTANGPGVGSASGFFTTPTNPSIPFGGASAISVTTAPVFGAVR